MTTKRNKTAIDRIVQRLSKKWQKDAESAISQLYNLLDSGKRTSEAISVLRNEYPALFTLPSIRPALVEAAAYGYDIMPSVLTSTQKNAWSEALAKPWDAGGLTLSKKLHGADVKMREAIADTIRDQMNRNAAWTDAATALYDGYGKGSVVRTQELPKYLSAVRYATKGSPEALRSARIAITNIERLARKGSPTKALKESYQQLIAAAENGTAEELEKACRVAIEEKSRYVAQRIIRTEMARAYADGFVAKMDADDDVVAVRLRLSTRHPVFDICDFFADADMYGLGKGVYPKDKAPPIPLHPHCMCRLEEVFSWELDISKAKNQVKQAGNKWLNGLTDRQRREVLGIEGDKAWKEGENWQKYLRNWKGLAKPDTRLSENALGELQGQGKKTIITQKTIDELAEVRFPGFTARENSLMQQRYRELLTYSRDNNNSNEVSFVLSRNLIDKVIEKGTSENTVLGKRSINKIFTEKKLIILHNHPRNTTFSELDIEKLITFNNVDAISLVTNNGHVEMLKKTNQYSKMKANNIIGYVFDKLKGKSVTYEHIVSSLLSEFEKQGVLVWKK